MMVRMKEKKEERTRKKKRTILERIVNVWCVHSLCSEFIESLKIALVGHRVFTVVARNVLLQWSIVGKLLALLAGNIKHRGSLLEGSVCDEEVEDGRKRRREEKEGGLGRDE